MKTSEKLTVPSPEYYLIFLLLFPWSEHTCCRFGNFLIFVEGEMVLVFLKYHPICDSDHAICRGD